MKRSMAELRRLAEVRISSCLTAVMARRQRCSPDPDLRPEALQRAIVSIWKSRDVLESIVDGDKPARYLLTCIRHELRKTPRKDLRLLKGKLRIDPDGTIDQRPSVELTSANPQTQVENRDWYEAVIKIGDNDPILIMTYEEGLSDREIALKLGLSEENVRFRRWWRLGKIRKSLKVA